MPSRCIMRLVFRARRRIDVDRVRDVADAADQFLRRFVSHDPRQRRIGVEQRAGRRRHIDSVDRAFEQLAIAFLGEPLLGQRVDRGLARGVGIDQRAAEHLGGAGDVADLVVDVGGGNRGVLLAAGQRADRAGDRLRADARSGAPRTAPPTSPISTPDDAEQDALPFVVAQRPGEIAGQHPAAAGADVAQQIGHPPDQPAFGAEHLLVELGDLGFGRREIELIASA